MNVAEKICEKAKKLPETLANKVLELIEKIIDQQDAGVEDLKMAQEVVMKSQVHRCRRIY